jgi:hypothetical protein
MNTKVSVVFSIIAAAPTVVNPCLLGTIPETTLTGTTVCLLPTYGGYGRGFGHG